MKTRLQLQPAAAAEGAGVRGTKPGLVSESVMGQQAAGCAARLSDGVEALARQTCSVAAQPRYDLCVHGASGDNGCADTAA